MKERPILFSGPMVRAILEGQKTQTRRIVKLPSWSTQMWEHSGPYEDDPSSIEVISRVSGCTVEYKCPYGQPGDRLWVRETWANNEWPIGHPYEYKATAKEDGSPEEGPWKPSIHMPRKASRILLEITDIRVEQLLMISESDAIAEGIEKWPDGNYKAYGKYPGKYYNARNSFLSLWDSINGKDANSLNPWVWVITFKRI